MKNQIRKIIIIHIFSLFFTAGLVAQSNTAKVEIQTSAQCGTCKAAIESGLTNTNGVKSAILNDETKIVTVKFNTEKLTEAQIRKLITMIGYDADDLPADAEAYGHLEACCRKQ